jgi:hypothetical protein
MPYVCRYMQVAAEHAPLARSLTEALAGEAGRGMFTFALSPSGAAPATHYLTEGWIEPQFAALMVDPAALAAACEAAGAGVTRAQIDALLAAAVIAESDGNPLARASEQGLLPVLGDAAP